MRLALIYNFAQHYRTNIFTLLDQNLDIDFYFGDHYLNVKKMDYGLLHHPVTEVKNKALGPAGWQTGVVKLVFQKYDTFIMLGDPMSLSTWLVLLIGRLFGKRVYFWTHGWYGKETRVKAWIKKVFFRLANGSFLYGNYAKDLMIKEGLDGEKLHVIHNSLLYDKQVELRDQLRPTGLYNTHFGNDLPVVIFIGRLTKIKKLDQLLEAQLMCKQRGHKFNVAFIGDGTEKESLERMVQESGLSGNVWFYGPSYDEQELSQLIYEADVCVAPGNIGLTAMHAMVYGCPCISHNDFPYQMPEFEAIREGLTGSYFERDNVESLAECICKWLVESQNSREDVRQACYEEIDQNWNPHMQLNIIKEVIK